MFCTIWVSVQSAVCDMFFGYFIATSMTQACVPRDTDSSWLYFYDIDDSYDIDGKTNVATAQVNPKDSAVRGLKAKLQSYDDEDAATQCCCIAIAAVRRYMDMWCTRNQTAKQLTSFVNHHFQNFPEPAKSCVSPFLFILALCVDRDQRRATLTPRFGFTPRSYLWKLGLARVRVLQTMELPSVIQKRVKVVAGWVEKVVLIPDCRVKLSGTKKHHDRTGLVVQSRKPLKAGRVPILLDGDEKPVSVLCSALTAEL